MPRFVALVCPQFAAALWLLAGSGPAQAQVTITVDSTAQEVTLAQPTGLANGNCTLGEAILAGNARSVVDGCNGASAPGTVVTLDLVAGTYTFDAVGESAGMAGAASPFALPAITQSTAIQGNGAVLRRNPAPGTPPMGLLAFATDGMNVSVASLRLEGGVRGLSNVSSPPAGIATLMGVSLTELRLTDVVFAQTLGVPFSLNVTSLARLQRVTVIADDLRCLRPTLSSSGGGAVTIEVLDSEFTDGRGGLNIQPGSQHASASVVISDSRFLRNRGPNGAGLRVASNQPGLQIALSNNQFVDNTGPTGGGVEIQLGPDGAPAVVTSTGNLFSGNLATGNGGALRINGSSTLGYRFSSIGDTFLGNAGIDGGALRIDGIVAEPVVVERASFLNNSASGGTAVGFGATHVGVPRIAMRITRSSFTGNADSTGAANLLGIFGPGHRVQVDNSTIDGNFASGRLLLGGNGDSALEAEALTITRNGARIAIDALTGGATLRNTVIADNHVSAACISNAGGTIVNAGGLFVQDASCNSAARTEDPRLGPLASNGGSTLNRLPLDGSPLRDAGVIPALELQVDQRGATRVQSIAADIGAVETDGAAVFASGFEPKG